MPSLLYLFLPPACASPLLPVSPASSFLAFNSVDRYDGDDEQESSILNIKHNGYVVNIGFYWDDKTGYVRLFMQSDPAAFK